jgi:hypothetical protein
MSAALPRISQDLLERDEENYLWIAGRINLRFWRKADNAE